MPDSLLPKPKFRGDLLMQCASHSAIATFAVRMPTPNRIESNVLLQLDLAGRLRARRRATPAEFVATLELQERRYKEVGAAPLHWKKP